MIVRGGIVQSVRLGSVDCLRESIYSTASSSSKAQVASPSFQNNTRAITSQARPSWSKRQYKAAQSRMITTQEKSSTVADSTFPVFNRIADFRKWRAQASSKGKTVGFVPTMGALHDGHLSLVRESLKENDETVVSIFVNPAQFAPTEDLSSYPRTLSSDIDALSSLLGKKRVSAIFAPTVTEMYPSPDGQPFTQHVKDQVGAFVEVQGLQSQMEGASRPTFFRGVATVCTKLFHIVEPNLAYFGQKDIQQAIVLRRLVSDLLFSYPPSAQAIRVLATTRDSEDGLALSSRNAYLTPRSRMHATVLYKALCAGRNTWKRASDSNQRTSQMVSATLAEANKVAQTATTEAAADGISIEVLYISLNDPVTLQDLSQDTNFSDKNRGAVLSAAALIKEGQDGRVTRLIDNFLLGFTM